MPQQQESMAIGDDTVVSFQTEMPLPLQQAMTRFIEGHPNWISTAWSRRPWRGFWCRTGLSPGRSPGFMWAICFAGKRCCTASEFGSRPSGPVR